MARAGAGGWQRWFGGASGASSLLLSSCLVTDQPTYGEPNVPAHLVRAAPDDFEYAEASSDCEDSSATMPLVSFRLHVSDPNKDDRLIAHVFVNGDYIGSSSERIEPNGKVEREDLVMCVELGRLNTAPCNLVEILVSREFDERFPDQPEEPGDLSSERWWMFAASDTWPEATPEDCAKQERAMEDE